MIKLIEKFEIDNYICYSYKFKDSKFKIKDYMIGVAGEYPKGKITSQDTGWTFSNFETLSDNCLEQAQLMINQIKSYWEQRN